MLPPVPNHFLFFKQITFLFRLTQILTMVTDQGKPVKSRTLLSSSNKHLFRVVETIQRKLTMYALNFK